MKCLAIHSSPNVDGLSAATAQAVLNGFASEGGDVEFINLNKIDIRPCKACERGWGQCREGECIQKDGLETIRQKMGEADAFVFVTPVYWHDLSESAKRFLDRLAESRDLQRKGYPRRDQDYRGRRCGWEREWCR